VCGEEATSINYLNLKELLIALGLISEYGASSDSQERVLMYDMWRCLQGEERQEVTVENFYTLVLGILRMNDHKKFAPESEEPV
jgi:hypothetical protein